MNGGYVSRIDLEDYPKIFNRHWYPARRAKNIYAMSDTPNKGELMHRMILPGSEVVDHKNGDGLDNRKSNLRGVTHKQNIRNSSRNAANSSGYKGVARYRYGWRAYIKIDGKQKHLGVYPCRLAAAYAYDIASRSMFGEYARPNF